MHSRARRIAPETETARRIPPPNLDCLGPYTSKYALAGETRYMILATLQTCVLPDGTEKRAPEVTFRRASRAGSGA
jgi:hypothetical protein